VGALYTYKEDDVALADDRVSDTDTTNYIELLSYDSLTKEIKGTFNLRFKVLAKNPSLIAPDSVVLRNGKFHTKIQY